MCQLAGVDFLQCNARGKSGSVIGSFSLFFFLYKIDVNNILHLLVEEH